MAQPYDIKYQSPTPTPPEEPIAPTPVAPTPITPTPLTPQPVDRDLLPESLMARIGLSKGGVDALEGGIDAYQDLIENAALILTRRTAEAFRPQQKSLGGTEPIPSAFESLLGLFSKGAGAAFESISPVGTGLPPVITETLLNVPLKELNENVAKLFPEPTGDDWAYTTHQYGPDPEDIEVIPRWSEVDIDITDSANPSAFNAEQLGRFIATGLGTFDKESYKNMSAWEREWLYPAQIAALGTPALRGTLGLIKPAQETKAIKGLGLFSDKKIPSPLTSEGDHYPVISKIFKELSLANGLRKRLNETITAGSKMLKESFVTPGARIPFVDISKEYLGGLAKSPKLEATAKEPVLGAKAKTGIPTIKEIAKLPIGWNESIQNFAKRAYAFTADDILELQEIVWRKTRDAAKGTNSITRRIATKGFRTPVASRALDDASDVIMGRTDDFYEESKDAAEYAANMEAMAKMFDPAFKPNQSQLGRIEQMFGTEIAETIFNIPKRLDEKYITDPILDGLGALKAMVASIDFSGIANQGWKMAFSPHSVEYFKAIGPGLRMADPEIGIMKFDEMARGIKEHKYYTTVVEAAGDVFDVLELSSTRGRTSTQMEDRFISDWAYKIPGVKLSEQSYTGFLNKLRWDIMYRQLETWAKRGHRTTKEEIHAFAEYILITTGRATGDSIEKFFTPSGTRVLGNVFFSPRHMVSIPQFYWRGLKCAFDLASDAVGVGVTGGRFVAKPSAIFGSGKFNEISRLHATTLTMHLAKGTGLLYGLSEGIKYWPNKVKIHNEATGKVEEVDVKRDVKIGVDPTATDFGNLSVGPYKYNLFGGDASFFRTVFRGGLGKTTTGSGLEIDTNIVDEAKKYLRNKLSPGFGEIINTIKKEDFLGNTVKPVWKLDTWEEVEEGIVDRFASILMQEVREQGALMDDWAKNPLLLSPSLFGIMTSVYDTPETIKNSLSVDRFGLLYEDLIDEPDGVNKQLSIDMSPEYMNWQEKKNEKKALPNPEEVWATNLTLYKDTVLKAENELMNFLDAPRQGEFGQQYNKTLTTAIQRYTSTKGSAFRNLIPHYVEDVKAAQMAERGTKEDIFNTYRSQYWDAELPVNYTTGVPDHEARKRIQEAVLTEAEIVLGPELAFFITQKNPVSQNPDPRIREAINAAVDQYRDDTDYLTTNFYDLSDQIVARKYNGKYIELYNSYKQDSNQFITEILEPDFMRLLVDIKEAKEIWRRADPKIEVAMWRLGNIQTDAIFNQQAKAKVVEIIKAQQEQNAR